ncbi:hypothetical protein LguiB_002134 [Lonicera macranthoides]
MCARFRAPITRDLRIDFGCILQMEDRFWSVFLLPQERFVFSYEYVAFDLVKALVVAGAFAGVIKLWDYEETKAGDREKLMEETCRYWPLLICSPTARAPHFK